MHADNPASGPLDQQADWLQRYRFGLRVTETGQVVAVGDGIAWIRGLPSAAIDDVLQLEDGSRAMVFDLNEQQIGAILLTETAALTAGIAAYPTRRALSVPVGEGLLGRVVDPLGTPLDGLGPLTQIHDYHPLEHASPPIIARDFVHAPLYTGSKIIDTLIPIGKGQRQLIVGDEGLGRSTLALDAVIHQRGKEICCVYVLIGQKRSAVVKTIETLREFGALEYTAVVVAEAGALPGLQHLAPFAGCTLAEAWMQAGKDTLVIYDDLSTHARTYRELSLLLRRPPGREAYPGDIFSVHARLLERSTCLAADHGGGSMTSLPIVETSEGEIAAYIPTNLISITDGQIYLDHELFAGGFRPAIDIGKSVSRIGGQAQHPMIKAESGRMKLDYLQFLELEMFTRFGTKLEARMQQAILRGQLLRELLKQEQLKPMQVEFHLAWLVAFNDGLFDGIAPEQIAAVLEALADFPGRPGLESPRAEWATYLRGFMQSLPGAAVEGQP